VAESAGVDVDEGFGVSRLARGPWARYVDPAIVAVIGHEMYELERSRVVFDSHAPFEYWEVETSPLNEGNFHCEAWDYADSSIEKMREGA
jgi:hypothetical protein